MLTCVAICLGFPRDDSNYKNYECGWWGGGEMNEADEMTLWVKVLGKQT